MVHMVHIVQMVLVMVDGTNLYCGMVVGVHLPSHLPLTVYYMVWLVEVYVLVYNMLVDVYILVQVVHVVQVVQVIQVEHVI